MPRCIYRCYKYFSFVGSVTLRKRQSMPNSYCSCLRSNVVRDDIQYIVSSFEVYFPACTADVLSETSTKLVVLPQSNVISVN